jgi:hypothetical protein
MRAGDFLANFQPGSIIDAMTLAAGGERWV